MRASLARAGAVLALVATLSACRRTLPPDPPAPRPPQTSGTLTLDGLQAAVTVVRDRWGIPHITASTTDDLFFAQGFVQAQDRLFQMDLWRRASQGRLSETLGANFIERDAMTRRFQFRGDIEREWESYGPDTRRIASAFTRGINAYVAVARTDLPEEFVLAGWSPEYWKPEDLLNRTDAFVASANAQDDLLRARLGASIGLDTVDRLLPLPDGRRLAVPPGVDLSAITYVVPETVRRMGTAPFFTALAAPVTSAPRASQRQVRLKPDATSLRGARLQAGLHVPFGSNAWVIGPSRSATGAPLLAVDPHRRMDAPSSRYLVHLSAPGWNVAGATSPWMPGVAIGHNDRIAWGMAASPLDTQDVFVERVNPADPHQVERNGRWVDMDVDLERIAVKGRTTPFQIERLYTSNGAIVALDRERHLAYTVRWTGTEPGGAAELAALAIDRASSWQEFLEAAEHWRMPSAEFVYADVEGRIGHQLAGLAPSRGPWNGALPAPGWTGAHGWRSGEPDAAAPARLDPADGVAIAANGSPARLARIAELVDVPGLRTVDDMRRAQLDVVAWSAARLQPLLGAVRGTPPDLDTLRQRLLAWDRRVEASSADAQLFVAWERAIARALAQRRVPSEFLDDVAQRIDVVSVMTRPTAVWFDGNPAADRDRLLLAALAVASAAPRQVDPTLTFVHPLAVFDDARRRFNVGPFPRAGYAETVLATTDRTGPSFRAVFDVSNWDRSVVVNAPGQSGSPASVHYDDLALPWAAGAYVPLAFSQAAVRDAAADTLTLAPRR
jgi:penicillin G amidase